MKIFKSLIIYACAFITINVSVASSANFYIDNTRVVMQNTTDPALINVYNLGDDKIIIQSKLKMLLQDMVKNQLVEVNQPVMSTPQVALVPSILNVNAKSHQPIRILALQQMESEEIAYRLFIKNISQKSVSFSGTTLEIGFSVPVYVLPKKVVEAFSFEVKHLESNNYVIKITNQGNVHIYIEGVTLFDNEKKDIAEIKISGVILSGKVANFNFTMDKKYASYKTFKNEVKMQNLINYLDEVTKTNVQNINLTH
ncbi:MAG: fimbria/pilus periplasmic chaperone [Burkholderiales bacterium]|nr:fimbria/pilus periplasmic chaperone [Burkholderiales bacterium]